MTIFIVCYESASREEKERKEKEEAFRDTLQGVGMTLRLSRAAWLLSYHADGQAGLLDYLRRHTDHQDRLLVVLGTTLPAFRNLYEDDLTIQNWIADNQ